MDEVFDQYETTEFHRIPDDCLGMICEFCSSRTLSKLCLVSRRIRWKRFAEERLRLEKSKWIVSFLLTPMTTLSYFKEFYEEEKKEKVVPPPSFQKNNKFEFDNRDKSIISTIGTKQVISKVFERLHQSKMELFKKHFLRDWNMKETRNWINQITGFQNDKTVKRAFLDNDIDGSIVVHLDTLTYENIGINKEDADLLDKERIIIEKLDNYFRNRKTKTKSKCSLM